MSSLLTLLNVGGADSPFGLLVEIPACTFRFPFFVFVGGMMIPLRVLLFLALSVGVVFCMKKRKLTEAPDSKDGQNQGDEMKPSDRPIQCEEEATKAKRTRVLKQRPRSPDRDLSPGRWVNTVICIDPANDNKQNGGSSSSRTAPSACFSGGSDSTSRSSTSACSSSCPNQALVDALADEVHDMTIRMMKMQDELRDLQGRPKLPKAPPRPMKKGDQLWIEPTQK